MLGLYHCFLFYTSVNLSPAQPPTLHAPLAGREQQSAVVDQGASRLHLDHETHRYAVGRVRVDAGKGLAVRRVIPELVGQHRVVLDDVNDDATVRHDRDTVVDFFLTRDGLDDRAAVNILGSWRRVGVIKLRRIQKFDDGRELLVRRVRDRNVEVVVVRRGSVIGQVLQPAV